MKRSQRYSPKFKKAFTAKRRTKAIAAQLKIVKLFGTIEYDPSYDYKAERKRDQSGKISTGR